MRHYIITFLCLIVGLVGIHAQKLEPNIKDDGVWNVNFMYWSSGYPAVDGVGGITVLCEVVKLGKEKPEPREFQSGQLKVVELLSPAAKELQGLKVISIKGCEGLKLKDHVIVCIGIERMPDGQSIHCVRKLKGTNCKIGHRLSLDNEEGYGEEENRALLELARKGFPSVDKLSADELRAFAVMDPDGVREALIRNSENKDKK